MLFGATALTVDGAVRPEVMASLETKEAGVTSTTEAAYVTSRLTGSLSGMLSGMLSAIGPLPAPKFQAKRAVSRSSG